MNSKKILILFYFQIFIICSVDSLASENIPPKTLIGEFIYSGMSYVRNLRITEVIDLSQGEGVERLNQLRKEGYTCIRQTAQRRLCSLNKKDVQLTPLQESFIANKFSRLRIQFQPPTQQPQIIFDGSEQQDYRLKQEVKIITEASEFKYLQIGLSVVKNKDFFIVLPSADENPALILSRQNEGLFNWPVILQTKEESQTWAYFIDVQFKN